MVKCHSGRVLQQKTKFGSRKEITCICLIHHLALVASHLNFQFLKKKSGPCCSGGPTSPVSSSHDFEHWTRLCSTLCANFCGRMSVGVAPKITVIGFAAPIYFYLHNLHKEEKAIILTPRKPTAFYTGWIHSNSISEVFLVNYHKVGELVWPPVTKQFITSDEETRSCAPFWYFKHS